MIIGVCGFGSTGSSAISDYLLEYGECFSVIDSLEFTWVTCVDGLIDLEYHIKNSHDRTSDSIVAIQRYINNAKNGYRKYVVGGGIPRNVYMNSVNSFVERITDVSWNWYDFRKPGLFAKYFDRYLLQNRIIPKIERRLGRQINIYPMKRVHLSVNNNDFLEAAKGQVRTLIEGLGGDYSKPIIIDQPFSGNNPQAAFPFFGEAKAIVSDRDPRDNYVFAKTKLLGKNHFMATENVYDFIKYYRVLRDNQPYKNEDDRVLRVNFEDMVYDYNNATKRIQEFLKIGENPNPKSIFVPEMSIANTQVWKRYPQFSKDISIIESELPDYLYDFNKFGEVKIEGEMFYGKSPLHK